MGENAGIEIFENVGLHFLWYRWYVSGRNSVLTKIVMNVLSPSVVDARPGRIWGETDPEEK